MCRIPYLQHEKRRRNGASPWASRHGYESRRQTRNGGVLPWLLSPSVFLAMTIVLLVHSTTIYNLELLKMTGLALNKGRQLILNGKGTDGNGFVRREASNDEKIHRKALFANHPKNFKTIVATRPTPLDPRRILDEIDRLSGAQLESQRSTDQQVTSDLQKQSEANGTENKMTKNDTALPDLRSTNNASERDRHVTKSAGSFRGAILQNGNSMQAGQNVTRLSYALYRILELFKCKSLLDYPAGDHVQWMPQLMHRIDFEHPDFKYYALDQNTTALDTVRHTQGHLASSEFYAVDPISGIPMQADLLFSWPGGDEKRDTLSPAVEDYSATMLLAMKHAKNMGVRYAIFGQFPSSETARPVYRNGRWKYEELLQDPFMFNDDIRGVVPMLDENQPYHKYLTLYSLREMQLEELSAKK